MVRFGTIADLVEAPLAGLDDKIVFVDEMMTRTQDDSGYRAAAPKRSRAAFEAARRGAVAAVIRSLGTDHHRFPHTGGMRYAKGMTTIPVGALSSPDADQLARAIERGSVRLRLFLGASGGGRSGGVWEGTPDQLVPSGNVIAELPGRTDEIVLVSAHLDSWDLGTGAVDDAAGVGVVMAAAKLVGDLPGKLKRTIRVVLFGSEEVGLGGARAYAQAYWKSLDKHVIATESDFGAGRIWRFQTRWGADKLDKAKIFSRVLSRLGVIQGNNEAYGGPDLQYLWPAGVPVVSLTQSGSDYYEVHHTADDTFDKIEPRDLAQNVAVYAAFIYLAAEIDGDFRAQTK